MSDLPHCWVLLNPNGFISGRWGPYGLQDAQNANIERFGALGEVVACDKLPESDKDRVHPHLTKEQSAGMARGIKERGD